MLRSGLIISVIIFLSCRAAVINAQFADFSRPYDGEGSQSLDFVYHSHEDMTDFLRFDIVGLKFQLIDFSFDVCVGKQHSDIQISQLYTR